MRFRDYAFAAAMCVATVVAAYRYGEIKNFLRESREYTFVVKGDECEVGQMMSHLEDATFQRVDQERVAEGTYRLTVKCPPDKVNRISNMLIRMSERKGGS